ncbi:MAG: hypothetical protein ACUVV1_10640 [Fimbriimonadales bacterium]
MRWMWVCLCIVCMWAHAGAQVNLAEEPRLQRPITLWLKMEPLRDVLRAASRQTGVALHCQDAIQHQKVSIFVENRPAAEILTQLASLFRYAWRQDEDAYVLYVPDETRLQEESVLRAHRAVRQQALRDVIRYAREAVANPPPNIDADDYAWTHEMPREDDPPEAWNRALINRTALWRAIRQHVQHQEENLPYLDENVVLLALLTFLPPQAERALLNGQLIGFSTRPAQGIYPIPAPIMAPWNVREYVWDDGSDIDRHPFGQEPRLWGIWVRLPERENFLEYSLVSLTRSGGSDHLHLSHYTRKLTFHTTPYVHDHPWVAAWRAWATPPNEWESRVPERAVEQRDDRPKPLLEPYKDDFIWGGMDFGFHNSADMLELFAWSTRLPVISEAFRTDIFYGDRNTSNNPRALLRDLSDQAWIRVEDTGYVLRRLRAYWSLRLVELPEDWLRPLEQRASQQRWLDIEDYITLAGRMNDTQVRWYENDDGVDYNTPVTVRFSWNTLANNLRGLRFLASLSLAQRKQLLRGDWMPTNTLTLAQRRRFQQALEDRFPPPERLLVIDAPYTSSPDFRRYELLGSDEEPPDMPVPDAPAFRLQTYGERPTSYWVRSAEGRSIGIGVSPREDLQQAARRLLEIYREEYADNPIAHMSVVHSEGCILELQAPPTQRKTYYIFQRRETPVDLRALEAQAPSRTSPPQNSPDDP